MTFLKYTNYWKSIVIQFISDQKDKKEEAKEKEYQDTELDDGLLKEPILG
jgi:hypothetical protein